MIGTILAILFGIVGLFIVCVIIYAIVKVFGFMLSFIFFCFWKVMIAIIVIAFLFVIF